MAELLRLDQFSEYQGGRFPVRLEGGSLELVLIEAEAVGKPRESAERPQAFSLIFRGPRDHPLEQKSYPIDHPALGTIDLFLVPIGPQGDSEGTHYEALFN